jgi:hypothetical protein
MYIIVQWAQSWYKHTMRLHVLHVSAYCGHHKPLQSPFFPHVIPPYIGQCLHIGSAFYKYVVYVIPLCYKMYSLLNCIFLKILQYSRKGHDNRWLKVISGMFRLISSEMRAQNALYFTSVGELVSVIFRDDIGITWIKLIYIFKWLSVTRDEVWIANWIYWTHNTRDYK